MTTETAIAKLPPETSDELDAAVERLLTQHDLRDLPPRERRLVLEQLCAKTHLNIMAAPFQFIEFFEPGSRDKVVKLYATAEAASQLLRIWQISVKKTRAEVVGELFVHEVEGLEVKTGRTGYASKYVPLTRRDRDGNFVKLSNQELANAFAKAETGARRRLAMAMIGLSLGPDPDEVHGWRTLTVDDAGNIIDHPTDEQKALSADPRMARAMNRAPAPLDPAGSPYEHAPDLVPSPEGLEPKKRQGGRQSFKPTAEDVRRWLGAWFAAVKDTSYDSDDARHAFMREYTMSFPLALQTESLGAFLEHATPRQAGDLLATIRRLADLEREEAAALDDEAGAPEDDDEDAF